MEMNLDIQIFIGPADHESLQNAVNALRMKGEFAIIEALTEIRFPLPQTMDIPLKDWPKGRIFAPTFELRWDKNGEAYRSVLAHENAFTWSAPNLSHFFEADTDIAEKFYGREPQNIYLWPENDMRLGRRLDKGLRPQQSLRYECLDSKRDDSKKNVLLETTLYRDAYGRLIFWRYRNMRWTS